MYRLVSPSLDDDDDDDECLISFISAHGTSGAPVACYLVVVYEEELIRLRREQPAPGAKGGLFFICVGCKNLT